MENDDEELLARVREGDGESFGILYERTRGWLLGAVIRPRVGAAEAEDVLSETWRTALHKLGAYEWRGIGLVRWLSAIARRKAQESSRRAGRGPAAVDLAALVDVVPDDAASAEAEMIRRETLKIARTRIGETLSRIPPRYARALEARLLQGKGRETCASELGVTVPTFDVILYRATRAFAKAWEAGGKGTPPASIEPEGRQAREALR